LRGGLVSKVLRINNIPKFGICIAEFYLKEKGFLILESLVSGEYAKLQDVISWIINILERCS